MKMIVLRFFHLSQVASSSEITSSFTRPPQRPSELLALRTYERRGGRHSLPAHGLETSSCCRISQWLLVSMSVDSLGREGTSFPQDTAGGIRKGTGEGAVKNIPIPACCHIQLFWQDEAEKAFPAVTIAFMGYCSLAAVMYRQLQPTGLQHWKPATAAANFGPNLRVTSSDSV